MSELPVGCRSVPGYEGDYAIDEGGRVWSCKSGAWRPKSAWPNNGALTVELWRNGLVTRRRVSVLVEETFGEEGHEEDRDRELRWYLEGQYELTDAELEKIFS